MKAGSGHPGFLCLLLRVGLAAVFLYAGAIKASTSVEFAATLVPFTILPVSSLSLISTVLPWVEVLAGILLLIPFTQRVGAGLVLLLCLSFCLLIGWALGNGIIVACSCFGQDESPAAWKMALTIGRDILLAGAALLVLCFPRNRPRSR